MLKLKDLFEIAIALSAVALFAYRAMMRFAAQPALSVHTHHGYGASCKATHSCGSRCHRGADHGGITMHLCDKCNVEY